MFFPFAVSPKLFDYAVAQLDKNFKKFNPQVKPIILPSFLSYNLYLAY